MFCEKCGKELLDGSKFCDGCGAEIENNKVEEKVKAKKRPYDSNAFKSESKYSLAKNWFMAFLFMLIVSLISGALSAIGIGVIIAPVFAISTYFMIRGLMNGKAIDFNLLIEPFKDLNKAFKVVGVSLLVSLIVFLGTILFIVPGIILALMYSQAVFIMIDKPETSVGDALKQSAEMMKGHKGEYFGFLLSFFGHYFLVFITCGLWSIYLMPYFSVSQVVYYDYVSAHYYN